MLHKKNTAWAQIKPSSHFVGSKPQFPQKFAAFFVFSSSLRRQKNTKTQTSYINHVTLWGKLFDFEAFSVAIVWLPWRQRSSESSGCSNRSPIESTVAAPGSCDWVVPLPSQSHHQDYHIYRIRDPYKPSFALLFRRGGTTQNIDQKENKAMQTKINYCWWKKSI